MFNDVPVGQDSMEKLDLDLECEGPAEAVSVLTWSFELQAADESFLELTLCFLFPEVKW